MTSNSDPVLVADLIGYVRLIDVIPSFILPIFQAGENSYVMLIQHIDEGFVQEFVEFDPNHLVVHQFDKQSRQVKSGDKPLFGYETLDGGAIIEERETLIWHLKEFIHSSELANRPFSRRQLV